MTFLSPTFMFIFLPIALGAYAIIPKYRKTDFLPVMGTVFYVCVNINDPFGLVYIVFAEASVILTTWLYKKTKKKIFFVICASVCSAAGIAVLILRLWKPFSFLQCAGLVMCLMSSVSLCIDVLRGEGRVPSTLWEGVVYITYFPFMLVGPFLRYGEFIKRLDDMNFGMEAFSKGAMLFLKGIVKSIAVGAVICKACYDVSASGNMGLFWILLISAAFSIGLYAFFSGYSDIGRGLSCMIGIDPDPDMGDPFLNPTPAAYLRRFFKGFSMFFIRYVTEPLVRAFGDGIPVRVVASIIAGAFLPALLCRSAVSFLIILPFSAVAQYFVLSGRAENKKSGRLRYVGGCVATFLIMMTAWSVVNAESVSGIIAFGKMISSNGVFYISRRALYEMMNLKYFILPLVAAGLSYAASEIIKRDGGDSDESTGFTVAKWSTALALIIMFVVCVTLLLPQFPDLATVPPLM